ncbi:hypothetical protein KC19_VG146300 [Ceratodon purpureus]|uniref:Secreted protein n=1 Tax=Ceratodon purpureus TaxID=3225 RepID=A0A8T0HQ75_CERPU|nr:hypothetical protein KC19_VG146300 [Ceratodon purpureus]
MHSLVIICFGFAHLFGSGICASHGNQSINFIQTHRSMIAEFGLQFENNLAPVTGRILSAPQHCSVEVGFAIREVHSVQQLYHKHIRWNRPWFSCIKASGGADGRHHRGCK